MKILIIKNRYKKKVDWKKGIEHIEKNTPLKLDIEELSTDLDFKFRDVSNATFKGCVLDIDRNVLRKIVPENKYHAVVIIYGNDAPGIRVSITENEPLYPNTDLVVVIKENDGGKTFNHELFHVFFKKLFRRGVYLQDPMDTYRNNNDLDSIDSNRTDALKLLKPHWKLIEDLSSGGMIQSAITAIKTDITPSKAKYKYFSESEVVGLKPDLVSLLDKARGIAGVPFKITSGLRSETENKKAGGVEDSAHMLGLAVDIATPTSDVRWKILNALLDVGFTRLGIGETFIHADVDKSKVQNVVWDYYK